MRLMAGQQSMFVAKRCSVLIATLWWQAAA
jgi:hypothetical protein